MPLSLRTTEIATDPFGAAMAMLSFQPLKLIVRRIVPCFAVSSTGSGEPAARA